MSLAPVRTAGSNSIPVWQGLGKDIQLLQGGVTLTTTGLPVNTIIPPGTPVVVDEAARTATFLGTGVMYATAGAAATTYQVKKGNTLFVGGFLATGAAGGASYAITAIDRTTSTLFDTVTVGTTIGAANADALVYQSTATGAAAGAYPAITGLVYDETIVNVAGLAEEISVVIRGTVYARRVPFNATIAAALTRIIYSQSK